MKASASIGSGLDHQGFTSGDLVMISGLDPLNAGRFARLDRSRISADGAVFWFIETIGTPLKTGISRRPLGDLSVVNERHLHAMTNKPGTSGHE